MTSLDPQLEADYETRSFVILDALALNAIRKLGDLSARAQKLGLPAFDIELGESQYRRSPDNPRVYDHYRTLKVTGGVPKLQGWSFFAKIEHSDEGNVVKGFWAGEDSPSQSGGSELFKRMTECPSNCDHCKTNRKRNVTFFFRNKQTDDVMQVGSSCVADFSGHQSPMTIASLAQAWPEVINELTSDPDDYGVSYGKPAFDTNEILAASAAVIREGGRWVPRHEDPWGVGSSGEVAGLLSSPRNYDALVTAVDVDKAAKVREWLCTEDFDNRGEVYRNNLQVLAKKDYISEKNVGLLASSVAAWEREQRQGQASNRKPLANIKLGKEKEKLTLQVIIEKIIPIDSGFGSLLHLMRDLESNARVIWYNSGASKFFEGDQYLITGTVNDWSPRDGVWQTKLTRVSSPDLKPIDVLAKEDTKALQKALKACTNINARNSKGETALIVASDKHRFHQDEQERILMLLDHGADPSIQDNDNRDRLNSFDRWVLGYDELLVAKGLETHPELSLNWPKSRMEEWGVQESIQALVLEAQSIPGLSSVDQKPDDTDEQEAESLAFGLA